MTKIELRLYIDPGQADLFINIKLPSGGFDRYTAVIDTGAEYSLMPIHLLDTIEYRVSPRGNIHIQQAGIAEQAFTATEAFITMTFEDIVGNTSPAIAVPVWFAPTKVFLLGWAGILDRATLHIEMGPTRQEWLRV